jgi:IS30 family transposase
MKRLPAVLRRSMTYDRGSDPLMVCKQTTAGQGMACHPELARRLKIDIWFCDPHAPSRQIAKAIA